MNEKVTFNITATMNKRWANTFCSMLKYMENCGEIGHSSGIRFYSDGDGDFRPKFDIDYSFEKDGYMFNDERIVGFNDTSDIYFDADIKRSEKE